MRTEITDVFILTGYNNIPNAGAPICAPTPVVINAIDATTASIVSFTFRMFLEKQALGIRL